VESSQAKSSQVKPPWERGHGVKSSQVEPPWERGHGASPTRSSGTRTARGQHRTSGREQTTAASVGPGFDRQSCTWLGRSETSSTSVLSTSGAQCAEDDAAGEGEGEGGGGLEAGSVPTAGVGGGGGGGRWTYLSQSSLAHVALSRWKASSDGCAGCSTRTMQHTQSAGHRIQDTPFQMQDTQCNTHECSTHRVQDTHTHTVQHTMQHTRVQHTRVQHTRSVAFCVFGIHASCGWRRV
jgi:hypothetical protein